MPCNERVPTTEYIMAVNRARAGGSHRGLSVAGTAVVRCRVRRLPHDWTERYNTVHVVW